ncbi:uncharacterized protein LOC118200132 [Stegodyphus dumicola]|uniref:uncharacterized protein LOC118200132 n=1 Tax=Stegodyphus dumicola TaxID=202533 RepID=UPI0015AFBBBC|nr:uncharacterized protein LOC118200132 [Stegodyphus dumicola]
MEKLNLPQNYSYKIVKIDFLSDISYSAAFRIAEVRDEESASLSNVVWRTARTFKCAGKYSIFRTDFRCQHNTDSRRRIKNVKISKNTNCQATLKIIVQSYLDNPDKTVKEFSCVIELHNVHNDAVDSAAALRFRDLSESTKEELKRLFRQGHTAASARWSLDMAFQINDAENYDRLVADASIFPSVSVIQHLFNNEFASLYGAKHGKDVISDLKAFCNNYSIVSAGKVSMKTVNNNIAVAICTPIMQRTATLLPQAKELILVDASGHMDVLNHRVYFFISPAVVGGAPVGCVITDVEKEEVFKTGMIDLFNYY